MENITDVYTGPCSSDSKYIKPFTIHYKQRLQSAHACFVCSVSVLVHNITRNLFVFVRQFRPAVYISQARSMLASATSTRIDPVVYPPRRACTLELCAGIVDKDVSAEEIARQELLEEVGYDVPVSKLEKIVFSRNSVGISGACQTMFYAPVTDSMKVGCGGGVAHEGEMIEVVEVKVDQCLENFLHDNTVERSMGLIFALVWFQQYKKT